jgi:hypothetical protein
MVLANQRRREEKMVDKFERIDDVITMMNSPAPPGVVEKLCQKLRDVETHEKNIRGDFIVNECRSHIFKQEDVKWMDVMVSAYVINGGIMIRDIIPPSLEEAKTEEADTVTQNKESSKIATTSSSSKATTSSSSKATTAASSKATTTASSKTAFAKASSTKTSSNTSPESISKTPSMMISSSASTNPTEPCNDQVPSNTAPSHEDVVLKEIESMIDNMGIVAVPS